MHECDAHNIVTPLLTQNDCEGGGEVFQVKAKDEQLNPYFGRSTFLTVSGQLHLESAVQGLPSVYTLSNCFRSEYSLSRRHLCEFSMLEVEQAYMDSLPILMDKVEALCKTLAGRLLERAADDLAFVQKQQPNPYVDKIINSTYLRITYDEAIELCRQHGGFDIELGANMNTKHETFLLQHFDHRPIFVTHYPFGMKPFYMLVEHDRALNFDLLYPVCGEVCGGSLREHRKEVMQRKFKDAEFDCTFDW